MFSLVQWINQFAERNSIKLTVHKSKMKRFLCWCDRKWCRLKATKQKLQWIQHLNMHDARCMTPNHNVFSSSLLFCWWMNSDFVSHHFHMNITNLHSSNSLWSLFGDLFTLFSYMHWVLWTPTPWHTFRFRCPNRNLCSSQQIKERRKKNTFHSIGEPPQR